MSDERDPRVNDLLVGLIPGATRSPDWADVVRRAESRGRWTGLRRLVPAVALAVVAAGLLIVLVRMAQRTSEPATGRDVHLSIFDRPRDERDGSSGVDRWGDSLPVDAENGVWYSQEFTIAGTTNRLFVGRRGTDSLCVILQLPTFGDCGTPDDLTDDGVMVFDAPDVTVGLAADGVTAVRRDALSPRVAVVANTFALPNTAPYSDLQIERGGRWSWVHPHFSVLDDPAATEKSSTLSSESVRAALGDEGVVRTLERSGLRVTVGKGAANLVCVHLAASDTALACDSKDAIAAAHGIGVVTSATATAPTHWLVALVPDGITRVRVRGRELPVEDNVVHVELKRPELPEVLLPTGEWTQMLGAAHGSGFPLSRRPIDPRDELPASIRRIASTALDRLRADSTRFSQEIEGVGFWWVERDDGVFVIAGTGHVRTGRIVPVFSDEVIIVDAAVGREPTTPWRFGPVVVAPDGYDSVVVGDTSIRIVDHLAVLPRSIVGEIITVSGPRGIVRLPIAAG